MPSPPPTPAARGMFARALLALGLLVGFYVLALGIAATLLLLPYLEVRYTQRIHLQVAIVCVLTAGAILYAVVPRPQRFQPPGPLLIRERHPRLFALLDDVARAAGQARPREVYLVSAVNAWVAERGGVLGVGGRRIMGLGLPLFAGLTVRELRAVLAHEFGHYAGGDTRLGGLVHVTRGAIGRTLIQLRADEDRPSLLQRPFIAYGNMFLRVTHTVSREQERCADALAARLEGADALDRGLRKLVILDDVFDTFLRNELNHVLSSQRLPPITDGLARFLAARSVSDSFASALDKVPEMSRRAAEQKPTGLARYESHPPVHERLEALAVATTEAPVREDSPAIALLDDWIEVEREMLVMMNPGKPAHPPVAWEEIAEVVYMPNKLESLQPVREEMADLTIADLGGPEAETIMRRVLRRWVRETEGKRPKMDAAEFEMQGLNLLGSSIDTTLHGQGWTAHTAPGEPITMKSGEHAFEATGSLRDRFEGKTDAEAWARRCAELGIGELRITIRKVGEDEAAKAAAAPSPEAVESGTPAPVARVAATPE
jgi:heat shock protein HtpX